MIESPPLDSQALASALKESLEGEVRFDPGTRALYTMDASNYRQVPIGVVLPKSERDIAETLALCRRFGAPVLSRGAGTSIAGQCCNIAVIMDLSKYLNRCLEINPGKRLARVEPGIVLDQLQKLCEPHGLLFGPDPATHSRCTLGGMIGNNSCGIHSLAYGKTVENVEALEILTYDGARMTVGPASESELEEIIRQGGRRGEIYSKLKALRDRYADLIRRRFPKLNRRVSGYNLDQLLPEKGFHVARALVGTEGTCVTILNATVRLAAKPEFKNLLVLGYPDIFSAADDTMRILEFHPDGFEGLDEKFIGNMKIKGMHAHSIPKLPEGKSWNLLEFSGASPEEAGEKAKKLMSVLNASSPKPGIRLFEKPEEVREIWSVRESAFGATVFVPGQKDIFAGWEDSASPPDKLGTYLRKLHALLKKYDYQTVVYGHFGEGCIHSRISFDFLSAPGIAKYRAFLEEASDLVLSLGGSLSGEHGDGQAHAELLPKMFGKELVKGFEEFKAIWDPQNKMNPGKVVHPYRVDENLKYIARASGPSEHLHFQFAEDQADFFKTTQRCIGIAKCRKTEDGVMCPSYMATQEEKHSTRGRAHLLYEMMRGEIIKGGWQDPHVKESLDLCLSCKACKTECPTNVDIASYKAEFLSHYYTQHRRPLHAYVLGGIHEGARLASRVPLLANFLTQTPFLKDVLKKFAGLSRERPLPAFARKSFKDRHKMRSPSRSAAKKPVLLWPDTVHNYFYPEILESSLAVLESLGYEVKVPASGLCCGRPLYDYGMLGQAKQYLLKILGHLGPDIDNGMPVIIAEPSCLSVFRDELLNFFPRNPRAQRLARQSFLLNEFLLKENIPIPKTSFSKKILVHGHCHQKALMGIKPELELFSRLGTQAQEIPSGCCGLAGSFGFTQDHYAVSMKIGEMDLFPKIRQAEPEAVILSSGFSCREQIRHGTGRTVLHPAELLHKLLKIGDTHEAKRSP